jgi:hypothetical protein
VRIVFSTFKKILFWSYDRGTWQYDVMCVLILAFVFLAPNSAFRNRPHSPVVVSADEVSTSGGPSIEQDIARHLSRQYGYEVTVSSIEPMMDGNGTIRYYLTHVSADRTATRK